MTRGWVPPLAFEDHFWDRINSILGRDLTEDEQKSIVLNLETISGMKVSADENKIATQKIKRGLDSFVTLPDDKVKDAYKAAHVSIRTQIQGALCAMKLPHCALDVTSNSPAAFVAAATMARNKMEDGAKSSSGYRRELARYILQLWKWLGCSDLAAWDNSECGTASPLVQFAMALFEVVEPKSELSFSRVRKILCEVIA
jgi:hypothetical protein